MWLLGAPATAVEIGCLWCHEAKVAQMRIVGHKSLDRPTYDRRYHQSEDSAKERSVTDWGGSEKRVNSIYTGGATSIYTERRQM